MKSAVVEFLDHEAKREAFRNEARKALSRYQKDGEHLTLYEALNLVDNMEIEDIRRIKEAEAQRVNRLIEEGGEPLQREYESGLRMWSNLREMALKETRRKAQDESTKP